MLFFIDVSIFAWRPFKTHRSHLNDRKFILSLAVFWLKLGFWPIILATDMLASQSRAL